jgi:hypothetical protein
MIIKKYYEELVNLGNFENVKIGLSLDLNVPDETYNNPIDIKKHSNRLFEICKRIVKDEIKQLKQEKENG